MKDWEHDLLTKQERKWSEYGLNFNEDDYKEFISFLLSSQLKEVLGAIESKIDKVEKYVSKGDGELFCDKFNDADQGVYYVLDKLRKSIKAEVEKLV